MIFKVLRVSAVLVVPLLLVTLTTETLAHGHKDRGKRPSVQLVEVIIAKSKPVGFKTVRTGTLKARRTVNIFNQEEGRIERLDVREGDLIKKGQVIVSLDQKLLSAELAKASATRNLADVDLKRIRELVKRKVTTRERLDKAETVLAIAEADESLIKTRLGYARIRAPFAGVVTERLAEPGDIAPRNSHLLTIIDPASLMTVVSISELVIPRLRVGDLAEVKIDALGNRNWKAQIGRIHPIIDPRTRQGTVEVELDPVPDGAVAGQLSRVTLRAPEVSKLVIPFAALRHDRTGEYAYVIVDDKATTERVRSGLRLGDQVEILEGLADGDAIVVRGFLGLRESQKVSIVGMEKRNE